MSVVVVPYDPRWPEEFEAIRADLARALEGVAVKSIEHVGSTSIPGLPAKPVIDIDIIVDRPTVAAAIEALTAWGGYEYRGELGIPDRHFFRATDTTNTTATTTRPKRNVYVCVDGSASLRNHLGVREVLRNDAALREEYGNVKIELAKKVADLPEYVKGKSDVIQKILAKAGISQEERDDIRTLNLRPPNSQATTGT